MPAPISSTETLVNSYTNDDQLSPTVTRLPDGGWIVLWMSRGQDGSNWGIFGQRYAASGAPTGGEFQVNTYTVDHQYFPSMAVLADGGWVVTWNSIGQDGDTVGVFGQRFDAAGAALGGEFQVNSATAGEQVNVSTAALADGGWISTYMSPDGSASGIYQQRFNAAGSAVGGEIHVSTTIADQQATPSVTGLADGGWILAWQSQGQDGDGWGVYTQRYSAAGAPLGGETLAAATTAGNQLEPSVALLADGGWLIAWMSSGQDGDGYGIYARRFDAAGAPVGGEFLVNSTTAGDQAYPTVTALDDGGWAIRWQQIEPGILPTGAHAASIYIQAYDASGARAGGETFVGASGENDAYSTGIAALADGSLVVAWGEYGTDGSAYGIYARHLAAAANVIDGTPNDDNIVGTPGNDQINGFGGNDRIDGVNGNDVVDGGDGDDVIVTWNGNDWIQGGNGNDQLSAGTGDDHVYGGAGNDYVSGREGDDVLDGGDGDDVLDGMRGVDVFIGGAGFDLVTFYEPQATQGVIADIGAQTISNDGFGNSETMSSIEGFNGGTRFADLFYGDGNHNLLVGSDGDTLYGFGGDDDFIVGGAPALLDGGDGTDTIDFFLLTRLVDLNADGIAEEQSADHGVDVDLRFNAINDDGFGNSGTVVSIENVGGSALDDSLFGNNVANSLAGFEGNDVIFGFAGNDVIDGGDGHDNLRGYDGDDQIFGGAGNDLIRGGNGNDYMDGGAGFDRASFFGTPGEALPATGVTVSLVLQGTPQDTGHGIDTLVGFEALSGTAFDDHLTGDNQANWLLSPGGGNDTLLGMGGDDLIEVANGNNILDGGGGIDTASFSPSFATGPVTVSLALQGVAQATGNGSMTLSGFENLSGTGFNDHLTGDGGANLLAGDAGDDVLSGGNGDDVLYGDGAVAIDFAPGTGTSGPIATFADRAAGNDVLNGGKGSDILLGGGGDDVLTGGQDADTFVFGPSSGHDHVTDFEKKDVIAIDGVAGVDDFSDLTITAVGKNAVISWGTGDTIILDGYKASKLSAADFSFGAAMPALLLADAGGHAQPAGADGWIV